MVRKIGLLLSGVAIGALCVLTLVPNSYNQSIAQAAGVSTYRQLSIFGDIFERVRASYVNEPTEEELIESAIKGMLTSLDPHSSYLNAKDFSDMRVQTRGEFGGLGIEVTLENETVRVVSPIEDTPAARAGVLAGDLIVEIDGENIRGITLQDAVEKMRGPVNTPIELSIRREGADDLVKITVVRDVIKVRSVRTRVEDDNIGVLDINAFNEQTFENLKVGIEKVRKEVGDENLKGYIVDLRLNPGGLLDQAVNVSDSFLDRGLIVSTRGRNPEETRRHTARPGDLTGGKPVVVLINGGSASASEIVAGALQDYKRATVVGTRSFGKGSVQTIIPLGANGALRLTTALYYTPSDRSIQGKGITPDIIVEQPLPEELQGRVEARGESNLRGHIVGNEEDEEGSGSIAYVPPKAEDDVQFQYAKKLLLGTETHAAFPPNPEDAVPTEN